MEIAIVLAVVVAALIYLGTRLTAVARGSGETGGCGSCGGGCSGGDPGSPAGCPLVEDPPRPEGQPQQPSR